MLWHFFLHFRARSEIAPCSAGMDVMQLDPIQVGASGESVSLVNALTDDFLFESDESFNAAET